jgi:hypothetical protein
MRKLKLIPLSLTIIITVSWANLGRLCFQSLTVDIPYKQHLDVETLLLLIPPGDLVNLLITGLVIFLPFSLLILLALIFRKEESQSTTSRYY